MRWMLIFSLLLTGCLNTGRLRTERVELKPPGNASVPSVVNSGEKTTETVIPAGTEKRTVETQATATSPARVETTYVFPTESRETVREQTDSVTLANERAPDQTVALRKADNEARAPLLYAALASLAATAVMMFLKYPTGAMLTGSAAGVFFLAWKLADVPAWLWVVGAVAIAGAVFLVIGHERGERAKP